MSLHLSDMPLDGLQVQLVTTGWHGAILVIAYLMDERTTRGKGHRSCLYTKKAFSDSVNVKDTIFVDRGAKSTQ